MENKLPQLPQKMYIAYSNKLGFFYSSLSDNEESARAETYNYSGVDQKDISVLEVEIKVIEGQEILP